MSAAGWSRCAGWVVLLIAGMNPLVRAASSPTDPVAAGLASDAGLSLVPTRRIEFSASTATWLAMDVAPDGQRLVLEILGDLYLLPIGGGDAQPLTSGMAMDSQPRFSPDGRQIVFVSDRGGQDNVWLIGADGNGLRQLSQGDSRSEFASPAWAPDGSHVIVSRSSWALRTFELWAYHLQGGSGVQITKAKANKDTPVDQRANALGAVYSPDGRYLYYARKNGGFAYNLRLPQWQIARRDLWNDAETLITAAPGSAFRPVLSPDGRLLAYATRTNHRTVLRLRDLQTGVDRLLSDNVEGDEQESRFTRDLFPNYGFDPSGECLYFSADGMPARLHLATGVQTPIPFTAAISQALGPLTRHPRRLGIGPVKARILQQPSLSPDGRLLVFSAFMRIYSFEIATGRLRALTPEDQQAFYPKVAPDGRTLVYATWTSGGGQIYSVGLRGGPPRQISDQSGHYTDLAFSPDGARLVAIRASAFERMQREQDFGAPVDAELIWLPAQGGSATAILPATDLTRPHFGRDPERIYLNRNTGDFSESADGGLVSVRFDGSDLRDELSVVAPGIYSAQSDVQVGAITIAPNDRDLLLQHAGQLYLSARLSPWLGKQTLKLTGAQLPAVRLTSMGADHAGFSADGTSVYWVTGHTLYQRALQDIRFPPMFPTPDERNANARAKRSENFEGFRALEEAATVSRRLIEVYRPRYEPQGSYALVGATLITMAGEPLARSVVPDGVVLISGSRIQAVGSRAQVEIPAGTVQIDLSGQYLLPGFVDTHAHFRPRRGALDRGNASLLANLAYGVTTALDVQPSTLDVLAYEEAIDAGQMLGPRSLSTGPGIFNHHEFDSLESVYQVLRRYAEHYGVHNIKAYIAGDRRQRQWLVRSAQRLKLIPTTEGALDMKLDLTHAMDGFAGNEHNLPLTRLYDDVVQLVARSQIAYTPTLLVLFGGPWAEDYFYSRESPADDAKLRRFTPKAWLDARTQRRGSWVSDAEQRYTQVAAQAYKIVQAGGLVGVGSHGQLQGLGYHWELWALASGGFSPLQALQAATINGARSIGVAADVGSLEPGKLADMVVLAANPLSDLRATTSLTRIIKGGVVYDAHSLDELWPRQRPLPLQWWQTAPVSVPESAPAR